VEDRKQFVQLLLDLLSKKEALLSITAKLSSTLNLTALIESTVSTLPELLDADRASLFVVDEERQELWSKVALGLENQEIRFPLDKGIAGSIVRQGKLVNIEDAYADPDFNRDIDRQTGYQTKSILGIPIRNPQGVVVGVVEIINKNAGNFTRSDEVVLQGIGDVLAISLENSLLYERTYRQQKQVENLLKVANLLSSELDLDVLISTIMEKASEMVHADRASLFLIDHETQQLWSKVAQGTQEIRFPMTQGVAGQVATTGKSLNIIDAYQSPLFNKEVDVKTGYRTKTILCVPIRNISGELMGVTQVINKEQGVFTAADEEMLTAFSSQASISLENAQLYERTLNLKNFLDSILQNLSTGVLTLDQDEKLTTANQAAQKILALPNQQWQGAAAADILGQGAADLLDKFRQTLEHNTRIEEYDADYHTATGDPISINLVAQPLNDQITNEKLGVVVLVEDMTKEKRQRSMISRFLSKDIAERFLQEDWSTLMKGSKIEVTVLFSDIRSFTSITEANDAGEIVEMLNEYFSYMVDAIFTHGGTLDKYIGDAIMALFGAPIPNPDNAFQAIQGALEMKDQLAKFNLQRQKNNFFPIRAGIGLSSGEVLCGTIGSEKKMEYTGIGDDVNLAFRLEGTTKTYGVDIIISEFTYEKVVDRILVRELDKIRVVGKDIPVRIFELLGLKEDGLDSQDEAAVGYYHLGLEAARNREFGEAVESFRKVLKIWQEDQASQIWLKRCEEYMIFTPGDAWDGSFDLHEK
jgi:adenylate cyclase